ncbi:MULTISPECIES: helix-turn-helix transcriptional regulator [Nostocaceae]|uniref:Transcriptional regulator n=1 Tax=Trichormus variabilis NIES-23 TaxID=1973479 RepID=A0A1Z4KNK6_ANAVA|nr:MULTISPECIES: AraC family transcriptional regulator [Nostocaceae]BAY70532.1 transcriptional regulator [Trichormus variabilis NIES-23]HBW32254.1 AraC family transcriptional regulator [Nostoc sp. UBA8866]MBD2350684.1 helix-turn-helix transcriptional regulator [Trichormus variabilis FACHB-171]RUR83246.1 AraC family transcriptional regulator [Nostoc sp. PCC 7120 = FACHB-418]BAB76624.1 transcriptional regulator [Nostoc sp. PCC 7120 = FACHB-418]
MYIFTEKQYDELWEESIKTNGKLLLNHDGFDEIYQLENKFFSELTYTVELRPGLTLIVADARQHQNLKYWSIHAHPYPLISKFHLSGNCRTVTPGMKEIPDDYIEQVGKNYLFYLPNVDEIHDFTAAETILFITIQIDMEVFKNFSQDFASLPAPLQSLINKNYLPRFHYTVGEITPVMFMVLQQLLKPPFQGMMKRMYLESKVLELLALQLSQFSHHEPAMTAVANLRPVDIEKAYHARDIIMRQSENPPSLLELAQLVGLGDRKLRYCFREVFGTTVFGYLHDYRMEQAKMMLAGSKIQVAEVANAVGYSHLGYFAKAFKQKFGVSPKEFQFGKKQLS